jgi:2-hydroxychromene-2-carboxylate isomerase
MDWYFDFISPYSYLQFERMPEWPAGTVLVPRPILFAGLLNHWGQKGPAEIPAKREFTYRQAQWIADRANVPFRFPPRHPFNPINALRLCIAAGNSTEAIRTIFRFVWAEGGEADTPEGIAELARRLGMPDAATKIADPAVKATLRANGEDAIAAKVFGVPSLVIDGAVFWGQDATAMAMDFILHREHFETDAMRHAMAVPVGVSRA